MAPSQILTKATIPSYCHPGFPIAFKTNFLNLPWEKELPCTIQCHLTKK